MDTIKLVTEKVFTRKDCFFMMVNVITNIVQSMKESGYPESYCLHFLGAITGVGNKTLVQNYEYTAEDIRTLAADGLLEDKSFTASDKAN